MRSQIVPPFTLSFVTRSFANTSARSETSSGWSSCGEYLNEMRLIQRLAISGLLSVILILFLTGTLVTRRDFTSLIDRGIVPKNRNKPVNPAWTQDNVIPGQDELQIENNDIDQRLNNKQKQSEYSEVGPPPAFLPGVYVVRPPDPPLDDITNQRREKVKEVRVIMHETL